MKLKMHRPALVMNRIGASLIDMFLISVMYGAVVAIMTGNYSAMFKRFNISLGDFLTKTSSSHKHLVLPFHYPSLNLAVF